MSESPSHSPVPALPAAIGFAVAFAPLAGWYLHRMGDSSDEPLGILALVFAIGLMWSCRASLHAGLMDRILALGSLLLYGAMIWFEFPPLLRALPALGAVVLWIGLWRLPGVALLLVLSLPVVASMQFYLGYPMRVVTAEIASSTLELLSVPADREGTQLILHGNAVGVDAPCSGVRMLWMALFFAAALSALFRLRWIAASGLMVAAIAVTVIANSVRATILFFPEAGLFHLPAWSHDGAGLLCHVLGLFVLLATARRFQSTHLVPAPA